MAKKQSLFIAIAPFLKGVAQIMLQENAWTGLLFLVGIFCGSLTMGLAAIFSVLVGTFTAKFFKYDEGEINSGLYGFSATLVGVALVVFFEPTIMIWLTIFIGSMLATSIQHFFIVKKIPGFTFPFILVTWGFLAVFHYFPALVTLQPQTVDVAGNSDLILFPHAIGQVIFQGSVWAGIAFFIGVLIHKPIAAVYTLIATLISAGIAYQFGEPLHDIYLGLLSYNAVLCAITFAGTKRVDFILALLSIVLSVLIMIMMRKLNLPALTFPFVAATWFSLIAKHIFQAKRQEIPQ
ncbi:urea transporter [Pedobacter sp. LMG 31464]|uniref:Urea transporter n=2 Tax=Pedobacter planticolens TaxID=2679964 RepID=A0A923E098_9SPHI|nr:urea transporter [Pedobacter planticolens]